jgi:hypothetical protein
MWVVLPVSERMFRLVSTSSTSARWAWDITKNLIWFTVRHIKHGNKLYINLCPYWITRCQRHSDVNVNLPENGRTVQGTCHKSVTFSLKSTACGWYIGLHNNGPHSWIKTLRHAVWQVSCMLVQLFQLAWEPGCWFLAENWKLRRSVIRPAVSSCVDSCLTVPANHSVKHRTF